MLCGALQSCLERHRVRQPMLQGPLLPLCRSFCRQAVGAPKKCRILGVGATPKPLTLPPTMPCCVIPFSRSHVTTAKGIPVTVGNWQLCSRALAVYR